MELAGHLKTVRLAKYLGMYELVPDELVNGAPLYVRRRKGEYATFFLYKTNDGGGHWMATPEQSYIALNGGAIASSRPSELPTDPGLTWKFAQNGKWEDCPDTTCTIVDPPQEEDGQGGGTEEAKEDSAASKISYAEQLYEVAETLYDGLEDQAIGAGDDEYQRDFDDTLFCPPGVSEGAEEAGSKESVDAQAARAAKAKARLVLAAARWEQAAKLGHAASQVRRDV